MFSREGVKKESGEASLWWLAVTTGGSVAEAGLWMAPGKLLSGLP